MPPGQRTALLVTGPAGSGKSTLGAAVATATGAALVDLDVVSNPLVAVVADLVGAGSDIDDPRLQRLVRQARYDTLLGCAGDQLRCGLDVVLTAPFTAELGSVDAFGPVETRLATAGADRVALVWLECPTDELLRRLLTRAEARDGRKLTGPDAEQRLLAGVAPPSVPAHTIDARSASADQVRSVLRLLG